MIKIKKSGFNEFHKMLGILPKRVNDRVVQKATVSAMREARKFIKKAAPTGKEKSPSSEKYGSIKKNIRVIKLRRVAQFEKAARVDTGKAFWAVFYDRGTKRQPPRPFFKSAIDAASSAIYKKYADVLADGIEREMARSKR